MRAPVHHTEQDIQKMIAESRRQMMLNRKVVVDNVHEPIVAALPPVDPVEIARSEYWREYRQRWLAVAVAVAGGMLGGALVLQIEMWREWMY